MEIAADDKLLDWVEQAALENIRAHIKSADDIKRESSIALAVLLAGASGSLAYAAKALEAPINNHVALAFGVLSVYLFALCAALVIRCLRVGSFPSPTNQPNNLYQKSHQLYRLREVELRNMQKRIEDAAEINEATTKWLNGVRAAATASPLILGVTFFLSYRGLLS